ncbi:MAG: hypothetical protein R3Y19_00140 [Rikenellaceae bacterium]
MFSDARVTWASLEVQGSRGGASALLNFLAEILAIAIELFCFLKIWQCSREAVGVARAMK